MYGLPEVGKAGRAIDGALDYILEHIGEVAAESARQADVEWALLYVKAVADVMVNSPLEERIKFAAEIQATLLERDLLPEPTRIIVRTELDAPPAEGDTLLPNPDDFRVGDDSE